MKKECTEEPPIELLVGIEQFNRGKYYECHETLEDIWREEQGSIRNLYKGILQIGVAIFHAKRSNLNGAMRLVSSGMDLLKPFAPACMGVDVADLMQSAGRLREELNQLASDQDRVLEAVPVVKLIPPPHD